MLLNEGSVHKERRDRQRDCGVCRHRIAAKNRFQKIKTSMSWSVADRHLIPGAVVRARIEFDEGYDYKVRPAIVVGKIGDDVTMIPCSSSPRASLDSDVFLGDLESAGLKKPTAARTHRVRTVDKRDCLEVLGQLSPCDLLRIPALRSSVDGLEPLLLGFENLGDDLSGGGRLMLG
jgi:hypothetical protein